MAPSQWAVFDRISDLHGAGEFEDAEAGARALAVAPRVRGGDPWLVPWLAMFSACTAAIAHGRGAEVLPELESMIAAAARRDDSGLYLRVRLLELRSNRVVALVQQDRCAEAEAEALDILRAITRLAHFVVVGKTELAVLTNLAVAVNRQGRYEEAEAIARGNLPRAHEPTADRLRSVLVDSLNGQGRYEEALAEVRKLTLVDPADCGDVDLATATALHGLGRRGEAEAAARSALAACEQFLHPAHPRIQDARTLLTRITAEDPDSD
ncbi:tetratricopeptide repeat protein [Streptomyces sp. NPDC059766]|uniref:tetratricopeptide repeat protein n=1 Tax=Streptomyces sp. NPDC059766 TaxID=3346940 RepID=UPI0036601DC0